MEIDGDPDLIQDEDELSKANLNGHSKTVSQTTTGSLNKSIFSSSNKDEEAIHDVFL